jgi:Glycosyl transferases group 1
MLAKILKSAHDQGLIFEALVVGDGEQRKQLEKLLSQYHLTANVHLLGLISHQRWLDILDSSDLLLMPSQYEGISVALLEAMAAGVVPVVAKVGGQEEIVSPNAGVLISHGANELQEYVVALCRLLSNPAELEQMSNQCKAIASSKLSWKDMIDNFLVLLDEAHQLRVDHPRLLISRSFGRELASLSLECNRLGEAAYWPWDTKPHSATADAAVLATSAEERRIAKFAILMSRTSLGRMIISSRFLKVIGKRFLKKTTNPSVA